MNIELVYRSVGRSQAYQHDHCLVRRSLAYRHDHCLVVIAGILALSLSSSWFVSRAYQHGVLSVQVCMHIGTRLVRSQGISFAAVIGFVAAADTGRFERAEDGERVGVL